MDINTWTYVYAYVYVCCACVLPALLADRRRPILTVDLAMLLPFVFIAYQQLTAASASSAAGA